MEFKDWAGALRKGMLVNSEALKKRQWYRVMYGIQSHGSDTLPCQCTKGVGERVRCIWNGQRLLKLGGAVGPGRGPFVPARTAPGNHFKHVIIERARGEGNAILDALVREGTLPEGPPWPGPLKASALPTTQRGRWTWRRGHRPDLEHPLRDYLMQDPPISMQEGPFRFHDFPGLTK